MEPTPLSGHLAGISDHPMGTHLSRTIMLADLRRLLAYVPTSADALAYRAAVIDENVLLKSTASTRKISFQRLHDLYVLDPAVLLFHALRELWSDDVEAQPLLALLCALARDVLLRSSAELIIALPTGEPVTPEQIAQSVSAVFPERYSEASLFSLGQHIASSWQQAGHLAGKMKKVRARASCRPNDEVAYVQWHRMLFARFLAENHLLMHPAGVPVTLDECAELAPEEGEPDAWQLAARYAGQMLPGIFRPSDPTAQLRFAPEGRTALERIVVELPAVVFTADDSLGWVYQFWQTKRKKAVNDSGRKIGGADISPVTQLFTEHYMVQFLLENSLGAWWAARGGTNSGRAGWS